MPKCLNGAEILLGLRLTEVCCDEFLHWVKFSLVEFLNILHNFWLNKLLYFPYLNVFFFFFCCFCIGSLLSDLKWCAAVLRSGMVAVLVFILQHAAALCWIFNNIASCCWFLNNCVFLSFLSCCIFNHEQGKVSINDYYSKNCI